MSVSSLIRGLLGTGAKVLTRPGDLSSYRYDAQGEGLPPVAVILPESTHQVSRAVKISRANGIPLVARGAATNLSGAALLREPAVVMSMVRMNRLLHLSPFEGVAVVQPGMTNWQLQEHLRPYGLFFPPDPASYRVSSLGGNIALNAGGLRGFKYGVTGNYVLALEVVLADGTVVRVGGPGGWAPGYDLPGLFTGSEGTLGIVTEATLQLSPLKPETRTALCFFDSPEAAGEAVQAVITSGLLPLTLELLDRTLLESALRYLDMEAEETYEALLLSEVEGYSHTVEDDFRDLLDLLSSKGARGMRVASSQEERDRLWAARRNAAAGVTLIKPNFSNEDVTVPPSQLVNMLRAVRQTSERYGVIVGNVFHAGDGNFHPIVLYDGSDPDETRRADEANHEITRLAVEMGGTITGEHGVGENKLWAMKSLYSPETLRFMYRIKETLDPHQCLNPGKAIPRQVSDLSQEGPVSPDQRLWVKGGGLSIPPPTPDRDCLEVEDRRLDLDRASLTCLLGSGLTLAEIREALGTEGLFFPWGRWEPGSSSLGGLVGRDVSGPGRQQYRGLADSLLGSEILTGTGHHIHPGGRTMKNVAGFNISRLMVGSLGTLGALKWGCYRVFTQPSDREWFRTRIPRDLSVEDILQVLLEADTHITSTVWLRGFDVDGLDKTSWWLLLELEGRTCRLREASQILGQSLEPLGLKLESWGGSEEGDQRIRRYLEGIHSLPSYQGTVKLSVWPRDLAGLLKEFSASQPLMVFPGEGAAQLILTEETSEPGREIPGNAPYSVIRQGPAWPSDLALMRMSEPFLQETMAKLKSALDPASVFPTLPFARCNW